MAKLAKFRSVIWSVAATVTAIFCFFHGSRRRMSNLQRTLQPRLHGHPRQLFLHLSDRVQSPHKPEDLQRSVVVLNCLAHNKPDSAKTSTTCTCALGSSHLADIDECLTVSCDGLCINTPGSFVCIPCPQGLAFSALAGRCAGV